MIFSAPTTGELLAWLRRAPKRTLSRAERVRLVLGVRRLDGLRLEDEPGDLGWFEEHLDELTGRLFAEGEVTPGTARNYEQSARRALAAYAEAMRPKLPSPPARENLSMTLEEETRDVLATLARCPRFRRRLLPAVAACLEDLAQESLGAP